MNRLYHGRSNRRLAPSPLELAGQARPGGIIVRGVIDFFGNGMPSHCRPLYRLQQGQRESVSASGLIQIEQQPGGRVTGIRWWTGEAREFGSQATIDHTSTGPPGLTSLDQMPAKAMWA